MELGYGRVSPFPDLQVAQLSPKLSLFSSLQRLGADENGLDWLPCNAETRAPAAVKPRKGDVAPAACIQQLLT